MSVLHATCKLTSNHGQCSVYSVSFFISNILVPLNEVGYWTKAQRAANGTYMWSSGMPLQYTHWENGTTLNENCVGIDATTWGWKDKPCTDLSTPLCQRI